jgi:hypothetical protein
MKQTTNNKLNKQQIKQTTNNKLNKLQITN